MVGECAMRLDGLLGYVDVVCGWRASRKKQCRAENESRKVDGSGRQQAGRSATLEGCVRASEQLGGSNLIGSLRRWEGTKRRGP